MLRHLGYAAISLSVDARTNRTCRIRNATPDRLRELIASNLDGLKRVLRFNARSGIYLYRISSLVIPLASHPVNQVRWWDDFAEDLMEIGSFIRLHRMRVSMHPGQYTVLNSPRPSIVEDSRAEIAWHARFLDCLGVDTDAKIVVHLGGAYGEKAVAMDRFVRAAGELPDACRDRLVIENDERVFTVEDALEVSGRTRLPVVFDWLHHTANPGSAATFGLLRQVFDTWQPEDGPPKIHLSSPARGGRLGQHADWVEPADAIELLRTSPTTPFDCMLEAKKKDLALLRLREQLRERGVEEEGRAVPRGAARRRPVVASEAM